MRIRRRDWRTGLQERLTGPVERERDWLIDLQVQIGVQDMERDAARIAEQERTNRPL